MPADSVLNEGDSPVCEEQPVDPQDQPAFLSQNALKRGPRLTPTISNNKT